MGLARYTAWTSIMTLSLLTACSSDSGGGGGDGAPPAGPQGNPAAALDLLPNELSPSGCLNLQLVSEAFALFPKDAVIREYTKSLQMANKSTDGKALPRLRNMTAETAFASYSFDEKPQPDFINEMGAVVQTGCESVEITDKINGVERFAVQSDSTASMLHLKTTDGHKERIFLLKSPRELELTTIAQRVDRCPDFLKVQSTTLRTRVWGTAAEVNATRPTIAVDLLKKVAIAVVEMPSGLAREISQAPGEYVEPTVADLQELKSAALDSKIVACPFDASPPTGDEPPPEEESPTPSPSPVPSPTPAP